MRLGRAAAFALLAAFVVLVPCAPISGADLDTLEIVSKSGVHVFTVELAVSDEQRARGLMFRRELGGGRVGRGIAQPGSAGVLGTPGRRFESGCPDHARGY